MLARWNRWRNGFTLIELLVVIVILGILMAVALPTYLRQQSKAKESQTKQYLVTAWRSARAELTSNTTSGYPYSDVLLTDLKADQPQLSFLVGSQAQATAINHVVIDASSGGNTLILYAKSANGTVYKLSADPTDDAADASHLAAAPAGYSVAVLGSNPIGYWRLDDASAATLADSSGNGHSGSYNCVNGSGCPQVFGVGGATTDGDQAVTMNSASIANKAYASVPYSAALTPTQFTIEGWINATPSLTGTISYIADDEHYTGSAVQGWEFYRDFGTGGGGGSGSGGLVLVFGWSSGSAIACTSPSEVTAGTWHYVAATYDGANVKLYIDGALDKTCAVAGTQQNPSDPFYVGGGHNTSYRGFYGTIDDVALYNSALSAATITSHYTSR